MAKFKDAAHVAAAPAPDFMDDSPEGIDASARFIWLAIVNRIKTAPNRMRDGRPGYIWQGEGGVKAVIAELWPETEGGYTADKGKVEAIKLAINHYHRETGTLRCMTRARQGIPAQWWVSQYWTGLTITHVAAATEEENKEEELMTDISNSTSLVCREEGCGYSTQYPQIRASHELRMHAFRIAMDGTRVAVSDEEFPDAELGALILKVARRIREPEAMHYFVREVQAMEPRASRSRTRRVLLELVASNACDLVEFGSTEHFTRYFLASRAAEAAAKTVAQLTGEVPTEVVNPDRSFDLHITNLEGLLEDLRLLKGLEGELTEDLQSKLDAKDVELERLRAELADVKRERDQLKKTLAIFKDNFSQFGKMLEG